MRCIVSGMGNLDSGIGNYNSGMRNYDSGIGTMIQGWEL